MFVRNAYPRLFFCGGKNAVTRLVIFEIMKRAFFQLHLAVFLAGFTAILGRLISLQEGWLVWYRLLFTFLILSVMAVFRKESVRLPLRDILFIFLIGFIVAGHWVAFYGSVKYANASVALVCFGCTGLFTACLEPLISKSRFVVSEFLFGLLSLAGIFIIFDFYPGYKTGIVFGVISSLLAAIFPILNRQQVQQIPYRTVLFYEYLGALISLSMVLPFYFHWIPSSQCIPTLSDFAWIMVLVVFCTVWAMDLQFRALQRISAFTVNLTYALEPAYGIMLAFTFLGEGRYFGPSFYVGLGLVLLSVVFHTFRVARGHGLKNA